jgi:hypothetical protein
MHITKTLGRFCCAVALLVLIPAVSSAGQTKRLIAKYVNVRQLEMNETPDGTEKFEPTRQYLLKCFGKICTGRMPLIINKKVYYYNMIVTISNDDPEYARANIDLRPLESSCDPRCEEPTLNSIFAFLPWARQAHVTVPVKQNGQLSPSTPSNSTTDLIYRLRQEPVAYLDLSIEFV